MQASIERSQASNERMRDDINQRMQASIERSQASNERMRDDINQRMQASTDEIKASNERTQASFDEIKAFNERTQASFDEIKASNERINERFLDGLRSNIGEFLQWSEVKTNVEEELSQETTIKLGIIKDLEDNVKIERAQEKREVQADDVLRGSLPKDPDILCKVIRGKTRSSLNGRVCTQKWRSSGSQSSQKNGRTSISRMSLDQRPQKGRQRRVHATTDGQVSESALMLKYRFVDKPP
jgi:hypothetical protein